MLTLGIETATKQVSVAIGGHEGVIGLFEIARGRNHAEVLVPAIDAVCQQTGFALRDVNAIAVDIGPGLFTGLRVGIAAAKAIAQARRLPLIGISSLDLLAFVQLRAGRLVVPVIDARRGEVYYSAYRAVPGGMQRITEPRAASPEDLVTDLVAMGEYALCVGDGAQLYRHMLCTVTKVEIADHSSPYPSAAPLVRLAHSRALREEWVSPNEVEPLYLRKPDAEINWQTRDAAAKGASS